MSVTKIHLEPQRIKSISIIGNYKMKKVHVTHIEKKELVIG